VVETNAPNFEAVKAENREPWLRLSKDGSFVVCYHKDKKDWRSINYFAGKYNMTRDKLFFAIDSNAGVLSMPNGEDGQLAYNTKIILKLRV
jgi:hypothetical protein